MIEAQGATEDNPVMINADIDNFLETLEKNSKHKGKDKDSDDDTGMETVDINETIPRIIFLKQHRCAGIYDNTQQLQMNQMITLNIYFVLKEVSNHTMQPNLE